jgi:ankyrin repeat protein
MDAPKDRQFRWAARDGDLEAVAAALKEGMPVDVKDEYGDTALNLAAEYGHLEIVEHLMAAGADIENLGGAQKTPLMNATFAGRINVVQYLLDKGARINRDLLSSLQMKVNILEENAEDGMVLPEAAAAWRQFLDYMIAKWQEQNPPEA